MPAFAEKLSRAAGRWSDAMIEAGRSSAALITLASLVGYGLSWMLYRILATWPRDIHYDMTEAFAWSRVLAGGYDKHPPLSAWIVAAWFSVFPAADWAFTLLAIVNLVATLIIAWRMMARWLPPDKTIFGLALLTLIPFYNFHALKFNANTVLLPFWALTAYAVLRVCEQRSPIWALIAGLSAGAAMLGKYWSVFLVAGLALAVLLDRRRFAFLRSAVPLITVVTGLIVIAPHLAWLIRHDFPVTDYASARIFAIDPGPMVVCGRYVIGILAFLAIPLTLFAVLARPDRAALRDIFLPHEPQRQLMLGAFALPLLLPIVASLTLRLEISALWMIPGLTLLPLVLLSSPRIAITKKAVETMLGISAAFSLIMLLLSPWVSLGIHLTSTPRASEHASLLAARLQQQQPAAAPITHIAGDPELAMSVAFYLGKEVRYVPGGAGALKTLADNATQGAPIRGVAVCPATNEHCLADLKQVVRDTWPEISLSRGWDANFGRIPGRPLSYVAGIIPPVTTSNHDETTAR